jgi:hypothetical protein
VIFLYFKQISSCFFAATRGHAASILLDCLVVEGIRTCGVFFGDVIDKNEAALENWILPDEKIDGYL